MIRRKRVGSTGQLLGIAVLCVICALSNGVRASVEDAGTYGAAYLRVPVGAAGMSVPDVVAGMDPDASLVFSNPAVTGDLRSPQLFLSRASWLEDLTLNAASFATPVPRFGLVWSFGSRLLHSGDIQGYDADQNVVESESYYGLSFSSTVSRRFHSGIAIGGGVTYSREHLPGETGDGVSFSLGASYAKSSHRFDVYAENIGGTMSFAGRDYPIESRYIAGYGYSIIGGPGRLDLGTQVVVSNSELRQVEIGGAYRFNRFMTVRAGYNYAMNAAMDNGMPLTAGLGFHHGNLSFDYAYTSQEYFSGTHTFSVGFTFGRYTNMRADNAPPADDPVGLSQVEIANSAPVEKAVPVPVSATPVKSPSSDRPAQPAPVASYVVTGGTHSRMESAESEVRALRLLKVSATVEKTGNQYRVVIGRFGTRQEADTAVANYADRGHKFRVLTQRD
jgi:hypothetical protein